MCHKQRVERWCTLHNGYVEPGDPPFEFLYYCSPHCSEDDMLDTGIITKKWMECNECKRKQEEWRKKTDEERKRREEKANPQKPAPGNRPRTRAR